MRRPGMGRRPTLLAISTTVLGLVEEPARAGLLGSGHLQAAQATQRRLKVDGVLALRPSIDLFARWIRLADRTTSDCRDFATTVAGTKLLQSELY